MDLTWFGAYLKMGRSIWRQMLELWAKPTLNALTSTVKPNGILPVTGAWSGLIVWQLLSLTKINIGIATK